MKKVITVVIILALLGGISFLAYTRAQEKKNRKGMETGKDIQVRLGIPVELPNNGDIVDLAQLPIPSK